MGDSVAAILDSRTNRIRPGEVFMLNTPYNGGSHLPDITLVSPLFDAQGEKIEFVVASRAHHADIGGATPGSTRQANIAVVELGKLHQCPCFEAG